MTLAATDYAMSATLSCASGNNIKNNRDSNFINNSSDINQEKQSGSSLPISNDFAQYSKQIFKSFVTLQPSYAESKFGDLSATKDNELKPHKGSEDFTGSRNLQETNSISAFIDNHHFEGKISGSEDLFNITRCDGAAFREYELLSSAVKNAHFVRNDNANSTTIVEPMDKPPSQANDGTQATNHTMVNIKLKASTDVSINNSAGSNSRGIKVEGDTTNIHEISNLSIYGEHFSGDLAVLYKTIPQTNLRLTQALTNNNNEIVRKNSSPAVPTTITKEDNDAMTGIPKTMEKNNQLLANLLPTDIVIPKCYQRTYTNAPNAASRGSPRFNVVAENTKQTISNDCNHLQNNNSVLEVLSNEKLGLRSTLLTAEGAIKQPTASNAAFTLLTEIILRQDDYERQKQLIPDIAPVLQKEDQTHKLIPNSSSMTFPLQLPLPLSLSLPLPLPLPLPLMPLIDNLTNKNSAVSNYSSYEVPEFGFGNSGAECKTSLYSKHAPQLAGQREQQQATGLEQQQQQLTSNQQLAKKILYSRLLHPNALKQCEHLNDREVHLLDLIPSSLKQSSAESNVANVMHTRKNNRGQSAFSNSDNKTERVSKTANFASKVDTNNSFNNTKLSGFDLLSAQEAAITQAQLELEKFLTFSHQLTYIAHRGKNSSNKLISHIRTRVQQNMQQRQQLIHSTQAQLSQLRRQCASAKIYYERAMRRLHTSDSSKLCTQSQTRPQNSATNKVARAAVVAAIAAAADVEAMPVTTYVKSEDADDDKRKKVYVCESSPEISHPPQTLLQIELGIEHYVNEVCKTDLGVVNDEGENKYDSDQNEDGNKGNNVSCNERQKSFIYGLHDAATVEGRGKVTPTFSTGVNVNKTSSAAVSPICFWHPENDGLSFNEHTPTAVEIILECAASTVQANMCDPAFAINTLSKDEGPSSRYHNQSNSQFGVNSKYMSLSSEFLQSAFVPGTVRPDRATPASADSVSKDECSNLANSEKNERNGTKSLRTSSKLISTTMNSNTTNSTPNLTPTSTPTTTPTPPLNTPEKSRRKSRYARRIEITPAATLTQKNTNQNFLFYNQSNIHMLRQCDTIGNVTTGDVGDNSASSKTETSKQLESLNANHSMAETLSPVRNDGHKNINKQQQKQYGIEQQQQQAQISDCNGNNNGSRGTTNSDGIFSLKGSCSNATTTSATAAAAVVAFQEQAFNNIFKARFNALTAAAVLNATAADTADGPYDLSVSRRSKQTNLDSKISAANQQGSECKDNSNEKKKPHIKKPLNAFMLYMKEMRAKVVAECTLKESAAINQILGRRWHALGREEQAKYYELARRERQLHMQMYPDWSSRTNTSRGKKRKRKQDISDTGGGGNNMKKCRARFGLDQQNQWCKPCRRKKKCIRYMEALSGGGCRVGKDNYYQELDDLDDNVSDNLGSPSSIDDNKTRYYDNESLNHSLSSPDCQSALSSLQSPSTSMTSPLNLLVSPATVGLSFGLPESQQNHQNMQCQQQQLHILQPNSSVIDVTTQQIRKQQQQNSNQHQLDSQQPQGQASSTLTNISICEHTKSVRSFVSSGGGIGIGVNGPIIPPVLPNISPSGLCIGGNNNLTNTSTSSAAAVVSVAAFTERNMRSLLNPSPSSLLLSNASFPPTNLDPSEGAIVSIAQMLSSTNTVASSMATASAPISIVDKESTTDTSTTTATTSSPRANDEPICSSPYDRATLINNKSNDNNCNIEHISTANRDTSSTPRAVSKSKPILDGKSITASSTDSSPTADSYEKLIAPTHRNPIGANPHDINNPLSINQLTKCGESTHNNCNSCDTTKPKNTVTEGDPPYLDNSIPNTSNSITNGVAAQHYKQNNQQLITQPSLRLQPASTSAVQHQQLVASSLLPPLSTQYQQQFHFNSTTGTPPAPHHLVHNHSHHHHTHSPLFNQQFQQFSHHLASVAAAAAVARVHMPNLINAAAVVNVNDNLQRVDTSITFATDPTTNTNELPVSASSNVEKINATTPSCSSAKQSNSMVGLVSRLSNETTPAVTAAEMAPTTLPKTTTVTVGVDNRATVVGDVSERAAGSENGAITVT
ncbi:uncharacterized protein LOC101460344 isoform X2 [Ceratitis capitata]|uniref:uncharacterized protein LOC101460344 isoform X2 n=1 Tax=Ceratitis capitata TaxID=7213 RepID=UPI0006188A5C|nr:uncharacterized protein LOC101460344 isoform X2 [Ceratitis capitata]